MRKCFNTKVFQRKLFSPFNLSTVLCFLTNFLAASCVPLYMAQSAVSLIQRNGSRQDGGKLLGVRVAGAADAPDRLPIKSMSTPLPPAYP